MDIMKDGRSSSIWILNADGSNHQKLTSSTRNESNPRWSPDSKKISFISSSDDDNGSEIFIYWVDSKQYSSISQLSGSPRSIKWSRNGKYLGFSMFVPEKTLQLNYKSCEMISDDLYAEISKKYPNRDVEVDVSEDGENGSHAVYYKE